MFVVAVLDLEHEVFVIHIVAFGKNSSDEINSLRKTLIAHLKANKAPTKVPSEYAEFTNIFLPKLATELSEHTRINNHIIELVDDW